MLHPQSEPTSIESAADPSSQPLPYLCVAQWGLLLLLLAHFCVTVLPRSWRPLNTDFPNYYVAAHLVHEHIDATRAYEWTWFQREKDHAGVEQPLVTLTPITPFSTLVLYPVSSLPALTAKHLWLLFNAALLLAAIFMLHRLTGLSVVNVALLTLLSSPLGINFAFGQYYVLLLFLMTAACWLYVRERRVLSGILIGLAAGLKIFPAIFLLYFLRKRDFKAFGSALVTGLATMACSIAVFGWPMHHYYLSQVLSATLRGEGLDPYNLQLASLSALLHRLFIFEPQLNPFPAWNAPWLFAVLHPLLQMAVVIPAILLCVPKDSNPERLRTEYAAILLASLAISTSPSSYLFTLLILPVCILMEVLSRKKEYLLMAVVMVLYAAIGLGASQHPGVRGWHVLFATPRLYEAFALCGVAFFLLFRRRSQNRQDLVAWSLVFSTIVVFSVVSNLAAQRNVYAAYQDRIPLPPAVHMAMNPSAGKDGTIAFTALAEGRYRSAFLQGKDLHLATFDAGDTLSLATTDDGEWSEDSGRSSEVRFSSADVVPIENAESPVASRDNQWIAFLREDHGRNRLWIRPVHSSGSEERTITPPELNVLEMSFLPDGGLIASATENGVPHLLHVDQAGGLQSLISAETRYPAVSPDGQWLTYSQFDGRYWNLWLRHLADGRTSSVSDAACNNVGASWLPDSRTIVYSSDCGRALSFFALSKRQIIP